MIRAFVKPMFLVLIVGLVSGCATAQLSQGPDIRSLKANAGAAEVAVAMVEDARGGTRAGSIGATSVDVPTSVANMIHRYLTTALNSELGLNIKEAGKADKTVVSKITGLSIASFDAIMQPVKTQIKLDLSVLDQSSQPIYRQSYLGEYEERIGISIVDSKTGQLVESAVQRLIKEVTNDANLKKALLQ